MAFLFVWGGEATIAILEANQARRRVRKGVIQIAKEGLVINHFAKFVGFATWAAFDQYFRGLRGPWENMIRPSKS